MKEKLQEYLDFVHKTGYHYKTKEVLEIILDLDVLYTYCMRTNQKIGIIKQSKYNVHLVDLVKNKNGEIVPYERIVKTVQGNSVVILPFVGEKIVLLKQFRHALGEFQYAVPRGHGELSFTPVENARKEISEELNCESHNYVFLGYVVADSGLCGEKVNVFKCDVVKPNVKVMYENIVEYIEVTMQELQEMIKAGLVNDGFTLAAITLYRSICCI